MHPTERQIRIAQLYLRQEGYYDGAIDGLWWTKSKRAGKEWHQDLPLTDYAQPFYGTVRALAAQFLLQKLGLYRGDLDGLWGPISRAASVASKSHDLPLDQPAIVSPQSRPDHRHHTQPYDVAKSYLGTREIPGKNHNPVIVRWSRAVLSWVATDEVAWCSSFAIHCAREAGYESSNSLAARSWLNVGVDIPLSEARRGDIIILWRVSRSSWQGHVAFLDHYNRERGLLYLLGGNQGNEVNITSYPVGQFLGARRLRTLDQLQGSTSKT